MFAQIEKTLGRCTPPKSEYLGMGPIAKKLERSKVEKHSVKRRAKYLKPWCALFPYRAPFLPESKSLLEAKKTDP